MARSGERGKRQEGRGEEERGGKEGDARAGKGKRRGKRRQERGEGAGGRASSALFKTRTQRRRVGKNSKKSAGTLCFHRDYLFRRSKIQGLTVKTQCFL